jgi:hypothetical protein
MTGMSRVLPSRVPKKRTLGVGVRLRESEIRGVIGVVADASSEGDVGLGVASGGSEPGTGVAGKGIVASGRGVENPVAPAMSDVVRLAKWPAVMPPVLQST